MDCHGPACSIGDDDDTPWNSNAEVGLFASRSAAVERSDYYWLHIERSNRDCCGQLQCYRDGHIRIVEPFDDRGRNHTVESNFGVYTC